MNNTVALVAVTGMDQLLEIINNWLANPITAEGQPAHYKSVPNNRATRTSKFTIEADGGALCCELVCEWASAYGKAAEGEEADEHGYRDAYFEHCTLRILVTGTDNSPLHTPEKESLLWRVPELLATKPDSQDGPAPVELKKLNGKHETTWHIDSDRFNPSSRVQLV